MGCAVLPSLPFVRKHTVVTNDPICFFVLINLEIGP